MASIDDFDSLYLRIAGFLVVCCFVFEHHRRKHMSDLAEVQQRQRQRQQVHVNSVRAYFPVAVKRKQDIMKALILRTVAVSDITLPSGGDAKGEKNDIHSRGDVEQSLTQKSGLSSPTIDFSIRSAQRELIESSSCPLREVYLGLPVDEEMNQQEITLVSPLGHQCDECIDEGEGSMSHSARFSTKRGPISVMPLVDETNQEDQVTDPLKITPVMGMLLAEEENRESAGEGQLEDATCSICLLGYEEGDSIAWSCNPGCNHAFHEKCIVTWLMNKNDECPNCRNNYFVFEDEQNTHNDTDTERTESVVSDTSYEDTNRNQRHGNPANEYGNGAAEERV